MRFLVQHTISVETFCAPLPSPREPERGKSSDMAAWAQAGWRGGGRAGGRYIDRAGPRRAQPPRTGPTARVRSEAARSEARGRRARWVSGRGGPPFGSTVRARASRGGWHGMGRHGVSWRGGGGGAAARGGAAQGRADAVKGEDSQGSGAVAVPYGGLALGRPTAPPHPVPHPADRAEGHSSPPTRQVAEDTAEA